MAKKQKKVKERKPSLLRRWWGRQDTVRRGVIRRSVVWTLVGATALVGTVVGLGLLERHVLWEAPLKPGQKVRAVLVDAPAWLPMAVARRIRESLTPKPLRYNAPDLTSDICRRAEKEPWFRDVYRVWKNKAEDGVTGLVYIQAAYRRPIACVNRGTELLFVDSEGVVLPEGEVPRYVATVPPAQGRPAYRTCFISLSERPSGAEVREIHYVMIQGVAEPPPPPGGTWSGQDLADGLRLVELLMDREYSNQISVVDVGNFAQRLDRREAEIRMFAASGDGAPTEIRWGRFSIPTGDYYVSAERRLSYLDQYVSEHRGRLAGLSRYIDLRYDQLRFSTQ